MKTRIRSLLIALLTVLALFVPGCVGKNTCPCPATSKPATTLPAPVIAERPADATAYVVVRPPEELLDLAYTIAGDSDYKEFYRQAFLYFMRRGSSGSGFAVKSFYKIDKDRKLYPHTYVFTNRHVVFGASETFVSFDGGKTSSRGDIVYVSSKWDLAVLDIPISHSILKLDTSVIDEETPVGALGYPAVGMKGSYHVFNGIISRSCFTLAEYDPDRSEECMLGSSAAIDHGNSGGPLVLLDEKTKRTTNRVIGVNTIMFAELHDKFYAIPAPAVAEVLKEAEEVDNHRFDREWLTKELKKSCRNFLAEMTSASAQIDRLIPQISYRYVVEKGFDAFLE